MMLALRSGMAEEVSWALDRLLRLCSNEKFLLSAIPGLTDALFAWPEWYVERAVLDKISSLENPRVGARGRGHIVPSRIEGATKKSKKSQMQALFADEPGDAIKRRHALEAITILRTATAYNDANVQELLDNARSRTLILSALHQLELDSDENEEFLVNVLEIFHDLSSAGLTLPPTNAPDNGEPDPSRPRDPQRDVEQVALDRLVPAPRLCSSRTPRTRTTSRPTPPVSTPRSGISPSSRWTGSWLTRR
jgi:chromatin structure-remodeling complex subunit RSC9